MPVMYTQRAARSLDRLSALSDGLFGIAMTLLLLELHLPEADAIHSEAELWQALMVFSPGLLVCVMSFLTLGIFWIGQQSQLEHLQSSDRDVTWLQVCFLFLVSAIPLSTRLLIAFADSRIAVAVYWANLALLGLMLWLSWAHAVRANLLKDDVPPHYVHAYRRRILGAQSLYACAALLAFIHPAIAIGAIVLVQLAYALAVERLVDVVRARFGRVETKTAAEDQPPSE